MRKTLRFTGGILLAAAFVISSLWGLTRLLVPKYRGQVVEGAFIGEYYEEDSPHDVVFLGDCEVYENISPTALWREYGITSYIRGSAQQLIPQSYFLLKDTLRYEKPKAVVLSVAAMQQIGQVNETYNRMTLDGMRWSMEKARAIQETKLPGEHFLEYVFPLLRFHSRWSSLEPADLDWLSPQERTTHNGYYMRADIRPAGEFPAERRRPDYRFEEKGYEYLDRIRETCEEENIRLILFKAPSLYPAWHEEWNRQIEEYAAAHDLLYINALEAMEEIGIDFSEDTYDGGLHMNVYGAEKLSRWLGPILADTCGLLDHRTEEAFRAVWEEKETYYESMKQEQEEEFRRLGYLSQFADPDGQGETP